jgi:PAS domain S-box-containing protein
VHVTNWNKRAEEITGYTKNEILGKECSIFSEPFCKKRCGLYSEEVPKPIWRKECEIVAKDGRKITISKNVDYLRDRKGAIIGGIESFEDITEQKKVLAEKEQLQKEIFHNVKLASLGTWGAGIAHELNNPLAVISASAEMLLKKFQPCPDINSKCGEHLNAILIHAGRMTRIINHLTLFAQQGSAGPKTFNHLGHLLEDTLHLLNARFIQREVKLELNIPADLPKIQIIKNNIGSVFYHLISNALDAFDDNNIRSEKIIKISARPDGHKILLEIKDNAGGISPDILDKIFDPFFTTKQVGRGTGLGLSIVYGIINEHGGKIEVQSQKNKGTTFWITLPSSGEVLMPQAHGEAHSP